MTIHASYTASEYPRSRNPSVGGLPDIWTPNNGAYAGYIRNRFGLITKDNTGAGTPQNFSVSSSLTTPTGILLVWVGSVLSAPSGFGVLGVWQGATLTDNLWIGMDSGRAAKVSWRDASGSSLVNSMPGLKVGYQHTNIIVGYLYNAGAVRYVKVAVNGRVSFASGSEVAAPNFSSPYIAIGSSHAAGYAQYTITYAALVSDFTSPPSDSQMLSMSADLNVAFAYARRDATLNVRRIDNTLPLYTQVDDTPTCDTSDFIYTDEASSTTLQLSAVDDPASSTGHALTYKARSDSGGDLTATLQQGTGGGAVTIATRTHTNVPTDWTDYTMTLTSGEADSITDYSNLFVKLDGTP